MLVIATPAYDGRLSTAYTHSLLQTQVALAVNGIGMAPIFETGNALLEYARNLLVDRFLQSKAEALMFIDSDIGWDARDVLTLYKSGYEVVGGVAPMRHDGEGFCAKVIPHQSGIYLDVEHVGTGFLLIRRTAFEKMDVPVFTDPRSKRAVKAFFEVVIENGQMYGEDVEFCRRWRKVGKIKVFPDMNLRHIGSKSWTGNYADFLETSGATRQNPRGIEEILPKPSAGAYQGEAVSP